MPVIRYAGHDVAFADEGSGPTVLLIPGLGGRISFWRELWPRLISGYRALSFDRPGSGGSAAPNTVVAVEDLARIAVALCDELSISRAIVVGHSMGGAVAQAMAIDHPDRVQALVLSSTWARPDAYFEKAFAQRRDILVLGGPAAYARAQTLAVLAPAWIAANPEATEAFERDAENGCRDPDAILGRIDALLAFDRSDEVAKIAVPVLAVYCRDDQVVPAYMSIDLAARIAGARTTELTAGGHFAPLVTADDYADVVLGFIGEV